MKHSPTRGFRHLCLAGMAALVVSSAPGANLDTPAGVGSATIRAETYRGASAADGCPAQTNTSLADCVYGVHITNVQNNTATKAFDLGLFFAGWVRAAHSPDVPRTHTAEGVVRDFFYYLEQYRDDLGLSLTEVCEAARRPCDGVEQTWAQWKAKTQRPRH